MTQYPIFQNVFINSRKQIVIIRQYEDMEVPDYLIDSFCGIPRESYHAGYTNDDVIYRKYTIAQYFNLPPLNRFGYQMLSEEFLSEYDPAKIAHGRFELWQTEDDKAKGLVRMFEVKPLPQTLQLASTGKAEIAGRGTVYGINLEKHNLPKLRHELVEMLLGKQVEIDGQSCTVKGIEAFATPDGYEHSEVGLLVAP